MLNMCFTKPPKPSRKPIGLLLWQALMAFLACIIAKHYLTPTTRSQLLVDVATVEELLFLRFNADLWNIEDTVNVMRTMNNN